MPADRKSSSVSEQGTPGSQWRQTVVRELNFRKNHSLAPFTADDRSCLFDDLSHIGLPNRSSCLPPWRAAIIDRLSRRRLVTHPAFETTGSLWGARVYSSERGTAWSANVSARHRHHEQNRYRPHSFNQRQLLHIGRSWVRVVGKRSGRIVDRYHLATQSSEIPIIWEQAPLQQSTATKICVESLQSASSSSTERDGGRWRRFFPELYEAVPGHLTELA